jgi:uncharacterized membrane protein
LERNFIRFFYFFAIGANISLVAQVYNIPGDLNSFIITWMLLSLPLVYLLQSSIVSLYILQELLLWL